jgi:hypothetical protein
MTPGATQIAAFQKNSRANARSVIQRKPLDIANQRFSER